VHFCDGLFFIDVVCEFFARSLTLPRLTSEVLAIETIVASGSLYELLERLVALTLDPTAAEAYNGQQGGCYSVGFFFLRGRDELAASRAAVRPSSILVLTNRRGSRRTSIPSSCNAFKVACSVLCLLTAFKMMAAARSSSSASAIRGGGSFVLAIDFPLPRAAHEKDTPASTRAGSFYLSWSRRAFKRLP
jgi:Predicted membrane protein (DUF2238)